LFNEDATRDIGKHIETMIEVDSKSFSSEQARFLRIRVEIPLNQPLCRGGLVVNPEGDHSWVMFQYERIVGLCFFCGRLGHEEKACTQLNPNGEENPYGEWMKVGGRQHPMERDRYLEAHYDHRKKLPRPQEWCRNKLGQHR